MLSSLVQRFWSPESGLTFGAPVSSVLFWKAYNLMLSSELIYDRLLQEVLTIRR